MYKLRYNMEPVSEHSKEKVKANIQAVADKNKATKEPEVTDAEKKVKLLHYIYFYI